MRRREPSPDVCRAGGSRARARLVHHPKWRHLDTRSRLIVAALISAAANATELLWACRIYRAHQLGLAVPEIIAPDTWATKPRVRSTMRPGELSASNSGAYVRPLGAHKYTTRALDCSQRDKTTLLSEECSRAAVITGPLNQQTARCLHFHRPLPPTTATQRAIWWPCLHWPLASLRAAAAGLFSSGQLSRV